MNAAHLHLLVNHLPIVGFALGSFLLVVALFRRGDRGMFLASVLVLVISGGGALTAQLTGEPAEEVVEHLPGIPHNLAEKHEDVAIVAAVSAAFTAVFAVILFLFTIRRETVIPRAPLSVLLVAALVTCGTMTWTGMTGGKIRHSEVRGPAMTSAEH